MEGEQRLSRAEEAGVLVPVETKEKHHMGSEKPPFEPPDRGIGWESVMGD